MDARNLESRLFPAIDNDDGITLSSLFFRGVDPAYQENGVTLLGYAKAQKSPHCLKVIRQNLKEKQQREQLKQKQESEISKQLIDAVRYHRYKKIGELIKAGADVAKPIELAVELKHWDCVIEIAKHKKASESHEKHSYSMALRNAINAKHTIAIKFLLAQGGYSYHHWYDGVHYAIEHHDMELLELFLKKNKLRYGYLQLELHNDEKPIPFAAKKGQWEMVIKMAKVYMAYFNKYYWVINEPEFSQDLAEFNEAFLLAAKANQISPMKTLLEFRNTDINTYGGTSGNTSLHFSALNNNAEMAILLLQKGARGNFKNKAGKDFIHCAFESKHIDFINTVFASGMGFELLKFDAARLCEYMLAGVHFPSYDVNKRRKEVLNYICNLPQGPKKDEFIASALQPISMLAKHLWSYHCLHGKVHDFFHQKSSGAEFKRILELEASKSQTKELTHGI